MAMKELMRVTLDETQIREACEIAVRDRVSPDLAKEQICAVLQSTGKVAVDVIITKKHAPRKAKGTA